MRNLLIIIPVFFLFLESCTYDFVPPKIEPVDSVYFSETIKPIIKENCESCHNGNLSPNLLPENAYNSLIDNYVNIEKPEQSTIYLRLIGEESLMPPNSPLSQGKIDSVFIWIKQGAKNN